ARALSRLPLRRRRPRPRPGLGQRLRGRSGLHRRGHLPRPRGRRRQAGHPDGQDRGREPVARPRRAGGAGAAHAADPPGPGRAGVDPSRIGAVHLTHLHGDHFLGLPFLLLDGVYRGRRTAPLLVTGPPGTRERVAAAWAVAYPDAAKKPLPFALEVIELSPG